MKLLSSESKVITCILGLAVILISYRNNNVNTMYIYFNYQGWCDVLDSRRSEGYPLQSSLYLQYRLVYNVFVACKYVWSQYSCRIQSTLCIVMYSITKLNIDWSIMSLWYAIIILYLDEDMYSVNKHMLLCHT